MSPWWKGSISTPEEVGRIRKVRRTSRPLVALGACATAGGIQALRNFGDVKEFLSVVDARPDTLRTLEGSLPTGEVARVDWELRGCPVGRLQALEVVTALCTGARCPPTASAWGARRGAPQR